MNILDKIRSMSPIQRHFTSAALGVAAVASTAFLGIPGLITSIGGCLLVSSYSDPTAGRIGMFGADSLKNLGCFIGGQLLAPTLLTAAFSAAHAAEINVSPMELNTPIVEYVDAQPGLIDINADQPVLKLDA